MALNQKQMQAQKSMPSKNQAQALKVIPTQKQMQASNAAPGLGIKSPGIKQPIALPKNMTQKEMQTVGKASSGLNAQSARQAAAAKKPLLKKSGGAVKKPASKKAKR